MRGVSVRNITDFRSDLSVENMVDVMRDVIHGQCKRIIETESFVALGEDLMILNL